MDKKLTFNEIYSAYKRWVINNPNVVTDVESVMAWSSYLVAGKINKSPLVSELVYSISKLISLFNDRILSEAYSVDVENYGVREQIKLLLTVIHYTEVLIESVAEKKWGTRGKWTFATILQAFKCSSALILLLRFKDVPISHPPIASLQRSKLTEGKEADNIRLCDNSDSYFTLKRSGRVVRRVDGSMPVAFRDWQPVRIKNENLNCTIEIKDILYAECLHILKPMIHLAAMRVFGTKSWKQWLTALAVDITSMKLYNKHLREMSYDQRVELSRRKLGFVLYLLRSPMYNEYSKNVIEIFLESCSNKIPLMKFICGPITQYLNNWQNVYFYMWSS